jgi:hypothetical protein
MWQMMLNVLGSLGTWLKNHEWLAIWLEGIALVSLFIVEFRQFGKSHDDTIEQLEIAKKQAEAARLTAQSVMNSERAWLTGALEWSVKMGRIIFSEAPPLATDAAHLLKLRNDGRTPAWIETVCAGMEISGRDKQPEAPILQYIEPLSAGSQQTVQLSLSCPGKPKMLSSEQLQIHITVNYRDIFEVCQMQLEFSVNPLTEVISRFEKVHLNFNP